MFGHLLALHLALSIAAKTRYASVPVSLHSTPNRVHQCSQDLVLEYRQFDADRVSASC